MNLIDGKYYTPDYFGNNLNFLLSKELISIKEDKFKVNFVGKIINHIDNEIIRSYPKNTNTNLDIDYVLNTYSNVKKDNKILLTNYFFSIKGNKIFSEYSYYQKFLSVFSDSLTNDFLLPKKQIISNKGSKIDVLKTAISLPKNNKITYKQYDKSDSNIRNVFYSILKYLESKYACNNEKRLISELEDLYTYKGYSYRKIEIPESIPYVEVNHKSLYALELVNNYLSQCKVSKDYEINIFYTDKFEYIYETMLKKILKHNKFYKKQYIWIEPDYKNSDIDIYNHNFMGDCKYYNLSNLDKKSFHKELYEYNICTENKIPNYIFIPSNKTSLNKELNHDIFNLKIYEVSFDEIIKDLKNQTFNIYNKIATY